MEWKGKKISNVNIQKQNLIHKWKFISVFTSLRYLERNNREDLKSHG